MLIHPEINPVALQLGPLASERGLGTPLILGQDVLRELVLDLDTVGRRLRLSRPEDHQAPAALALIEVRRELRRIGVNINQIARALNTAVMDGMVLDLELAQLGAFQAEISAWVEALGEAFEGNLAYWAPAS